MTNDPYSASAGAREPATQKKSRADKSTRQTSGAFLSPAARSTKPLPGQDPPEDLDAAGQALWLAVAARFELEPWERCLLARAGATADRIAVMEDQLSRDGVLLPWGDGGQQRAHPLIDKLTAADALLARLLITLRIPPVEETPEIRRRSFRRYTGGQE